MWILFLSCYCLSLVCIRILSINSRKTEHYLYGHIY